MSNPITENAVSMTGYAQPVAYDENHLDETGYLTCKICKKIFYANIYTNEYHITSCTDEKQHQFIYVFGPNEQKSLLTSAKLDEARKQIPILIK